jgi:hypothetical protein
MNVSVEGNEAHLRAWIAREVIEGGLDGVHGVQDHAGGDGGLRDVQYEEVDGRHGWAYHVITWCDELNGGFAEFWSLITITALSTLVQMREVIRRNVVQHCTNVASIVTQTESTKYLL